jgi:predicted aspartyl protease
MTYSQEHEMGRFSVEFVIANNRDVLNAPVSAVIPDDIPHVRLSGVIDTDATRLVLPESAVTRLQLTSAGATRVRYADQRTDQRQRVTNVWLRLLGREGVFSAIIEPDRTDALIGAIVLEELDLVVDCVTQKLHPRDPNWIVSEIE